MNCTIREARTGDGEAILALMPRLAAFDIPDSRTPEQLWQDDAKLLRAWTNGKVEDCLVHVAENDDGEIMGFTIVRLRPEALGHEPSGHLETIAVDDRAE
ncbi:MAG: hypothetical protein ACE5OQ_16585, partial [Woeseia sp.]